MAVLAVATPVEQPAVPTPTPSCVKTFDQQDLRQYLRAVFLNRPTIGKAAKKRLARMLRCQRGGARARFLSRRYRKKISKRREAWLAERKLTPFGAWAIPAYIVFCESHGNFRARNAVSSAGGAYQILDTTWRAHGGTAYADSHPAAVAPPLEQHKIAGRIWRSGGASQWACA
jgi:hypothetical protein